MKKVARCGPGIPGALITLWLLGVGCLVPIGGEAQPDALRSADIQKKFSEVGQYQASGRYDLAVWTLEEILKSARIQDRQGEADDVATTLALHEMKSTTATLGSVIPTRLQDLERNDLARISAVLQGLDAQSAGLGQSILVNMQKDQELLGDTLPTNLHTFERCVAEVALFAKCLTEPSFGTRTVAELQNAAVSAAAAMDKACAATGDAPAQRFIAEAEAERAKITRMRATTTAWSTARRNLQDNEYACEGVRLDAEKGKLATVERSVGEYGPQLEAFAQLRDRMVAELDRALPQARANLDTLRRNSREIAAFIAAYNAGAADLETPAESTAPWTTKNAALLAAVEDELERIELRRARLAQEDIAQDRERLAQMHAQVTELEGRVRRLEEAVACADRVTVACAAHLAEADQALERTKTCVTRAGAREAVGAASARAAAAAATASTGGAASTGPAATPRTPAVHTPGSAASNTAAQAATPASGAPVAVAEVYGGLDIRGGRNPIRVGETVQFTATDMAGRPYTGVEWSSFEPDVLALDSSGTATGRRPGRVTLQAKIGEGLDARRAYLDVIVEEGTAAAVQPVPTATASVPTDAHKLDTAADKDKQGYGFTEGTTSSGPATPPPTGPAPTPSAGTTTGQDTRSQESTTSTADGFTDLGTQSGEGAVSLLTATAGQGAPGNEVYQEAFEAPVAPGPVPGPAAGGSGTQGPGAQGTGGAGGRPSPTPQTTTAAAGQPAAYHIFAAGSRLGWASGLAQYSVGPADASIITDLRTAGEHVMWANRESYEPLRAWPNWSSTRANFNGWADELARTPTDATRRQIPARAGGAANVLANEISAQMLASQRVEMPNCDAAYMRLGYQLAYGQQVMMIADEAASQGNGEAAARERTDAVSHLTTARQILIDYEKIKVVTGRCADLRDVRAGLDALLRLPPSDYYAQARAATATWQLALQRIAALRNSGPTTVQPQAAQPPVQTSPPTAPPPAPVIGSGTAPVRLRTDGYYQARNPRGGLQFIRFLNDRSLRIVVMEYVWSGEMTGNPPVPVSAPREAQDRQAVWLLQQNPARWQGADSLDIRFERQGNTIALRKEDPTRLGPRWFRITAPYVWCNDFAELELASESELFLQARCQPGYPKIPFVFVPHAW
jgi:hypothetical protein